MLARSDLEEQLIADTPEPTNPPLRAGHYPLVRYSTAILVPGAFLGEIACGLFFGTYTAVGATYALQLTGLDIPDLPDDYGNIGSVSSLRKMGHPLVETARWISASSEIVNGVTQFEAKSAINDVDNWFYNILNPESGFKAHYNASFKKTFSSFKNIAKTTYTGLSYALFLIGSAAGAYSDIEQIKQPFQDWMGEAAGDAALAYLGASAMLYCLLAFGPRTAKGMAFWLEAPTVMKRWANHGNPLIEAQCYLEGACVTVIRSSSLSFSFGRLAEQWGTNAPLFYTLGALGGFAQGAQIFYPATFNKYHQYTDTVTQSQRDAAYQQTYGTMSYGQRALVEIKRPFFIGLAQAGLGCYLMLNKVPFSDLMVYAGGSDEMAFGIHTTLAATVGLLCYFPFYKANMYAELNQKAAAEQERARADVPQTVINVEPDNDDEEEEYEIRPNRCAQFFGKAGAFGMVATRIFSSLASFVNNSQIGGSLSRRDWAAIAGSTGVVVGDNRYRTMTDASITTFAQLGCGTKVSKNGLFAENLRRRSISSSPLVESPAPSPHAIR